MTETATPELKWHDNGDEDACRAANEATAKQIDELIKNGEKTRVVEILEAWAPSSVLSCFRMLRTKRAQKLVNWMSDDLSLKILSQIDPRFNAVLFEEDTKAKFTKVIKRMRRDKAKRLLLELPEDYAEALIRDLPRAAELHAAIADEDSAVAAMRQGAIVVPESWTIRDVVYDIRTRSDQIEKIDSLHVVDDEGHLTGYLKLRDLVLHHREDLVSDVARRDPLSVTADTDQEEVLALANKRGENVIAVVDHHNKLLGAITPTELVRIATEEAEEDMLLMGGVSPESTSFDSPLQIVWRRLPWLLAGLIGAMVAATVIGSFEDALTEAAILASFIPVVMATAGNAGMQASTVSIQAITSNSTWSGDFMNRVGREVIGACINGVFLGVGVSVVVYLVSMIFPIDRPVHLGITVAVALFFVVLLAGTVGTVVPFMLKALNLDPAVATGIFILTANDVFGVLIFFVVATHIYL